MVLYKFVNLDTYSHDLATNTNTNTDETSVLACYHGNVGPDTLALGVGDLSDETNWSKHPVNYSTLFGTTRQIGWYNLSVNAEMSFAEAKDYWGFTDINGVSVYKYIFRMKENGEHLNDDGNSISLTTAEGEPVEYTYPVPPSSRVQFKAGVWHIINTETDTEDLQPYRSYWVLVQSVSNTNTITTPNGWSACAMSEANGKGIITMFAAGEEGEAGEEGGEADNPSYLYKSTDSGTNWTKINNITLNDSGSKIRSIACSDDGQKIILCRSDGSWDPDTGIITYFGAVYISEDGGVTWGEYKKSSDITSRYDSVAINVKSNEAVYAVTCGSDENLTDGMIFISRDSGATWVEKSLPKNTKPDGTEYNYPATNNPDDLLQGKDRNYSVAIDTDQNIFVSNFSGNLKCFTYADSGWQPPVVDIYVDGGNNIDPNSPYYNFYDESGNQLTTVNLDITNDYVFHRKDGATSHPFYINVLSSGAKIKDDGSTSGSGITGTKTFKLDLSKATSGSNIKLYCTAHPEMIINQTLRYITLTNPADIQQNEFCTTASLALSNSDTGVYLAFTEYGRTLLSEEITDISSLPSFNVTGSTNEFRNLSMTGTKLFGTYEPWDGVIAKYIPHLIEGSITGGFSIEDPIEDPIDIIIGVEAPPDGDGVAGGAAGGVVGDGEAAPPLP
jgi:photosystem II stability/assembly factor-like uncharacterized protein